MFSNDTEQFYPTPRYLALRMAKHVPLEAQSLLEPSAGYGALMGAVDSNRPYGSPYLSKYWCEINEERSKALRRHCRHGYLGDDFLATDIDKTFDCVIMNPPFNKAEEHFLKAYKLLKNNGTLICLVSKETLKEHSKKEKLMYQFIRRNEHTIEIIEDAFNRKESKRKTDVTCALIVLKKTSFNESETVDISDDFTYKKNELVKHVDNSSKALISHDYVQGLINHYNLTLKEYDNAMIAHQKLVNAFPKDIDKKMIPMFESSENFKKDFTEKCWAKIFDKTEIKNYMTKNMENEFQEFQVKQQNVEFNMTNIKQLIQNLMLSVNDITLTAVKDMFEKFTAYSEKNTNHHEGWKTNSSYKVNEKLILPDILAYKYNYEPHPREVSHVSMRFLEDIEKTICLAIGKRFEDVSIKNRSTIEYALGRNLCNDDFGVWHDSAFFKVKIFKKRTMHLVWKDKEVLNLINKLACESFSKNVGDNQF